jgi:hypothetical protein
MSAVTKPMSDTTITWPWTKTKWWKKFSRSSTRSGKQPDAADFNLAVTLVAPWEEYVLDLSPDFKLKGGDDALKRVIPDTGSVEEKILESWSTSVQANVDIGALMAAENTSDDKKKGGKGKDGKGADKDKDKDKDAKQMPGAGAADAEHAPSKQPHTSAPGHAGGKDPMLEYAAATALYQEVKLLNRYVADAALRRDYRAYVVRLQMSVVPFARHFPLDIYTNISFFPQIEPTPQAKKNGANPKRYPAEVVPLLVTDNLENTLKSQTVDSLRNLALTLSFLHPGVGGSASLGQKRDEFQHALGGDLNSLLTVGRVTDNSLQIRLGAERDVTSPSGYAMLPRTHNITVLLLVPAQFSDSENGDAAPRITVVSKTQLRYAETGATLPHQAKDDRRRNVEDLLKDLSDDHRKNVAKKLLRTVFDNDVEAFEQEFKEVKLSGNPLDLWCDIVETLGKSEFAAVRFELPPRARLPEDESVLAVDDGEQTILRLQHGRGLNQNGVTATLLVKTEAGELRIVPLTEPPGNEVNIMAGGHGMTIAFPSLSAWEIDVGDPPKLDEDNPRKVEVGTRLEPEIGSPVLQLGYALGRKWTRQETENAQAKSNERYYRVLYLKVRKQRRSARRRR